MQEGHESTREIVELAEQKKVSLVIPAYSLVEPYETLIRRHSMRKQRLTELDRELKQLSRTQPYQQHENAIEQVTTLLARSTQEEAQRLDEVLRKMIMLAESIPLTGEVIENSFHYQQLYGLQPQDAVVYSSIVFHLQQEQEVESCFLNRNAKDFQVPDLKQELRGLNCKIIYSFEKGLEYIQSKV